MSRSESQLSDHQRSSLQSFREIVSIDDEELCIQILQEHDWNLDAAINQFVNGQNSDRNDGVFHPPSSNSDSNIVRRANRGSEQNTQRASASSSSSGSSSSGRRSTAVVQNNGFLGYLTFPLRWLFQSAPLAINPELDATRFIDEYNIKYTSAHPAFHIGSYTSAVSTAFQHSKMLLVYLHSPIHEDSSRFCRNVLAAPSVVEYLGAHTVTWAGKVWDPEAYGLSTQLRVASFPFLALLVAQSNRTVQVAAKIQGCTDSDELLQKVRNTVTAFEGVMAQSQVEQRRREEAVRLRQQQDQEYRESLEADRRAQERAREEERVKAEKDEEERRQKELQEAIELSKRLSQQDKIRKIKELFQREPEPNAKAPDVTTIKFHLPKGKNLTRRFLKTDAVQRIFDFLSLHFDEQASEDEKITNFSVCSPFPKIELTDLSKTIEEMGLHPKGMLYVTDLDA